MTDMTSREILDAIDRTMREVAAQFAAEAERASPHPKQETEVAEEATPFIAHRD
jgi:hypothetical protein